MNKETFGSIEKYKMLEYLTKKISNLDRNKKEYLSTFINEFNQRLNNIDKLITDSSVK